MLLKLILVTLIWKLNEMILKEENLLEQDITVIIQDLKTVLGIGVVTNGDQEQK
jgi:hypothetical protein